jgi:hypothetical protein
LRDIGREEKQRHQAGDCDARAAWKDVGQFWLQAVFSLTNAKSRAWRLNYVIPRRGVDEIQCGEHRSFTIPWAITLRCDFNASDLSCLARQSKDAPQARRLLALATIHDGGKRTEAARLGKVTLQIVRSNLYV